MPLESSANNTFWRASCGVDRMYHSVESGRIVTGVSEHSFSIENKTEDNHNFRIHYSLEVQKGITDGNGNIVDWEDIRVHDDIEDGFTVDGGETGTHVEAAVEPTPDIDYLRSKTFTAEGGKWYKIVAYTLIKPPKHNPDFGDDIRFDDESEPFFIA